MTEEKVKGETGEMGADALIDQIVDYIDFATFNKIINKLTDYAEILSEGKISGIINFNYRLNSRGDAHVLVGISVATPEDRAAFTRRMDELGYRHTDLSDDDIAKEHVRHMVGGPAPEARQEHLYQINFPERPGALGDFLASLGSQWNISAFHYRNQASDTGNVLIGFEAADRTRLEFRLNDIGYEWTSIDNTPSMRLFMR